MRSSSFITAAGLAAASLLATSGAFSAVEEAAPQLASERASVVLPDSCSITAQAIDAKGFWGNYDITAEKGKISFKENWADSAEATLGFVPKTMTPANRSTADTRRYLVRDSKGKQSTATRKGTGDAVQVSVAASNEKPNAKVRYEENAINKGKSNLYQMLDNGDILRNGTRVIGGFAGVKQLSYLGSDEFKGGKSDNFLSVVGTQLVQYRFVATINDADEEVITTYRENLESKLRWDVFTQIVPGSCKDSKLGVPFAGKTAKGDVWVYFLSPTVTETNTRLIGGKEVAKARPDTLFR